MTAQDIEFIGYINTREFSEIHPPVGPVIDPAYVRTVANAHEAAGFDRALVAFHATTPDSIIVATYAAAATSRLNLMIAHRPGFSAPTVAARQLATLDQFASGRVAVHIITGGDDEDLARDGDFTPKDDRYARTSEYLDIMRQEWTSLQPFDYAGRFYKVKGANSAVRAEIPVYFGGASEAAIKVAGKHADVYALWGESRAQVAEIIGRVRAAAREHGRHPRFSLSFRPILAETEEKAWARAEAIYEKGLALDVGNDGKGNAGKAEASNVGSQRLRTMAAQGERLDKCLWTKMATLTGGRWNSTALVGTPSQVADTLADYYDLGVTTFLIRGYDPLEDALDYGRALIPLTRKLVAERRQALGLAAE